MFCITKLSIWISHRFKNKWRDTDSKTGFQQDGGQVGGQGID
jgi:hypothetical protein